MPVAHENITPACNQPSLSYKEDSMSQNILAIMRYALDEVVVRWVAEQCVKHPQGLSRSWVAQGLLT